MTRISFLMPTFNRAGLIAESLRTVLTQAGEDDEILVIDDGSDDGTPEIVAAMAPRVRYVRQRNAGKSSALNRGLAMTDGAYVWICDDDDLLRSRTVAALVTALETSDAGFVFGRHNRFKIGPDGTRVSLGTGYWPDLAHGGLNRHILEDAFFLQNGMLVRRTAYEAVGLFDESFLRSQDYEMFVRLATNCVGLFVDEVIFDQRVHDGARGPSKARHAANASGDVWLQYDRRIFEKHAAALSLPLFETMFETAEPDILARAAHLQRACVFARHGLWAAAFAEIDLAATSSPNHPLEAVERAICSRMLGSKYGIGSTSDPGVRAAFRRMIKRPGQSPEIVRAILSGVLWRLRRDRLDVRRDVLSLLDDVAGRSAILPLLAGHLVANNRRPASVALLHERRGTSARRERVASPPNNAER